MSRTGPAMSPTALVLEGEGTHVENESSIISRSKARKCGRRIKFEWSRMSDAQKESAHDVSKQLGPDDTQLGQDLDRFIQGAPRSNALEAFTKKLFFIPSSEMPAEHPHGLFSRELKRARNAGPTSLSLSIRMPMIRKINASSELTASFLQTLGKVRHATDAMNAVRLTGHPYLEKMVLTTGAASGGRMIFKAGRSSHHWKFLTKALARSAYKMFPSWCFTSGVFACTGVARID
eukprot:1573419-Karenia_brevis.AAC.2